MAYKPHLRMKVAVPALGDPAPVFHFRPDDEATVALYEAVQKSGMTASDTELKREVILPLLAIVNNCVSGWSGVEDDDGAPIEFSREELLGWDTQDRLEIGTAFLARERELDARAGLFAGQPTNSTDPAQNTEP